MRLGHRLSANDRRRLAMMYANNQGGSSRQSLLDGAPIRLPLTHSAIPTIGNLTPSFTRATTGTVSDNEGILRTAIAGEARFVGARRVRNWLSNASIPSEDFSNAAWAYDAGNTITANYAAAPDGTMTADRIQIAAGSLMRCNPSIGVVARSKTWLVTCYVRATSGSATFRYALSDNGVGTTYSSDITVTDSWATRVAYVATFGALGSGVLPGLADKVAGGGTDLIAWGFQLEDITGRTDQTTPSEYVSVGALDYRSSQDPLYLSLPGTAGHYASTPDSVAASVTGDIDIRVQCALTDWTPAGYAALAYKLGAAGQRSFYFAVVAGVSGNLEFAYSTDGTATIGATSTASASITDGATSWVRVTYNSSTGKVNFYKSADGSTWAPIGAEVSTAGGAIFNSTTVVTLGSGSAGTTDLLNGKIYSAQIYNTIGGTTPVVDFNPQRDAITPTGTITSSTTSEVWTINGASSVVRNAVFHGSGIDGVKAYNTDLTGAALPTAYTYDAVTLNGVAGTYVSTPDSVANSITGDIDIRCKVSLVNWASSGVQQEFVSKWGLAGAKSYRFYKETDEKLVLASAADGTNVVVGASTVVTGITNGATSWVRVTLDVNDGAGNRVYKFYTSTDGSTWTQLGATVTTAGATSIYNNANALNLGYEPANAIAPLSGKIYQAQIYNGINGTLAVDFNAARYAGGTTLTGSTGEVYTLNGSAVIHPTNYPNLGYLAEAAATNSLLQSNAFTTTWVDGSASPVQNAVGPDGSTSAWTLTDSSAVGGSYITQDITLTATSYTLSFRVKKTTGAQASYPVALFYLAATTGLAGVTVDTTNGVATAWTAYTGFTGVNGSATCKSYSANYWQVSLTFTGTAAAWTLRFYPAGTANATQSTGSLDLTAQGSAVFYGAQVELGSAATSYTPRGTAVDGSGTRNADVLTYTGGDIANIKTLACTFRRESGVSALASVVAISNNTASTYAAIVPTSATAIAFNGAVGGATQWLTTASNAYTPSTQAKAAWSQATNNVLMDFNGTAQTADTTATMPTVTQIDVGHLAGTIQLNGCVKNIYGWTRNLSQSELNAITN